jgi:hypothetical protein
MEYDLGTWAGTTATSTTVGINTFRRKPIHLL